MDGLSGYWVLAQTTAATPGAIRAGILARDGMSQTMAAG
jgi:hypothetical protein